MTKPPVLNQLNDIEAALRVIRDTEGISKATFATIQQGIDRVKTEYVRQHGAEIRRIALLETREKQLPALAQAANILLTIRTALPTDGNVDLQEAETAIVSAIRSVADQLKEVIGPRE